MQKCGYIGVEMCSGKQNVIQVIQLIRYGLKKKKRVNCINETPLFYVTTLPDVTQRKYDNRQNGPFT